MHVTGADVISVKGASLVFLTGGGTVTCTQDNYCQSTLGDESAALLCLSSRPLAGTWLVWSPTCRRFRWMHCSCPACVNVCIRALTLRPGWLSLGLVGEKGNMEVRMSHPWKQIHQLRLKIIASIHFVYCLSIQSRNIGCKGWLSRLGQSTTFLTLEGETHLIL